MIPRTTVKYIVKSSTQEKVDKCYEQQPDALFKQYFPTYQSITHFRKNNIIDYIMMQFITGHGRNYQYLHRFHLREDAYCQCDGETIQDVKHIIFYCQLHRKDRIRLRHCVQSVGWTWPPPMHAMVSGLEITATFKEFLHNIYPKL